MNEMRIKIEQYNWNEILISISNLLNNTNPCQIWMWNINIVNIEKTIVKVDKIKWHQVKSMVKKDR